MCAESIEKFVRSAVPGTATTVLASDSNGSLSSLGSKKPHRKTSSPGAHQRSRIRSRSAGGSKGSSWLTRTLKKAFNGSASAGSATASSSENVEDELTVTKRKSSFKLTGFRNSRRSSRPHKTTSKRIVIPQVEVTLTSNAPDNDSMPQLVSTELPEVVTEAANSSPEKSHNKQTKKSYSFLTKKFAV